MRERKSGRRIPTEVKRIEKYYTVKGDGVARLNLSKAIKSRAFQKSLSKLPETVS